MIAALLAAAPFVGLYAAMELEAYARRRRERRTRELRNLEMIERLRGRR